MTGSDPASAQPERRVIYDIGANNGDDLPYYLRKADLVVAVEANPVLARGIRQRFAEAVEDGRLAVENCVLTSDAGTAEVHFYIHKTSDVHSQFPEPEWPESFDKVKLPSLSVEQLVIRHGLPHYVKIDVEYYDQAILRALFAAQIRPPFLSAESHSIEVFALMVAEGGYDAFKLVDGISVESRYRDWPIETSRGGERHSFPYHSAGPFGDDIAGEWMSADDFFVVLAREGLGWKDVHASNVRPAVSARATDPEPRRRDLTPQRIARLVPAPLRATIRRLIGR